MSTRSQTIKIATLAWVIGLAMGAAAVYALERFQDSLAAEAAELEKQRREANTSALLEQWEAERAAAKRAENAERAEFVRQCMAEIIARADRLKSGNNESGLKFDVEVSADDERGCSRKYYSMKADRELREKYSSGD